MSAFEKAGRPLGNLVLLAPSLVGNLSILLILAVAGALAAFAPELYYEAVQEDGLLEWASFWAFMLAAGAFAATTVRRWRATSPAPWFVLCLTVFCAVVALEEISWGQRLIGFRPPSYFLGNNFQQELNFHNIMPSDLRQLGVALVILAYGILLPLAMRVRLINPLLARLGVVPPPAWAMVASGVMFVVYLWYPWDFTGEWIELALGLTFLFTADDLRRQDSRRMFAWRRGMQTVGLWIAVLCLGAVTTSFQGWRASNDPARTDAARVELDALRTDLASPVADSNCGAHKRLYTLMHQRRWDALGAGQFAKLGSLGVPEARIQYLLDPWNSPYWMRDLCTDAADNGRLAFVYSFGPNRRRDSTEHGIAGDDIGLVLGNASRRN